MKTLASQVLASIGAVFESMDSAETDMLMDSLLHAKRVFVVGRGRTGMIAGAFAMRLMHLGFDIYVVGEVATPRITRNDLLIACSGSGEVRMVQQMVRIAKQAGAETILVTYNPKSTIGRCVSRTVSIPAFVEGTGNRESSDILFPLGSMFEESLLLYLDLIVLMLMRRLKITERVMAERHTNLE